MKKLLPVFLLAAACCNPTAPSPKTTYLPVDTLPKTCPPGSRQVGFMGGTLIERYPDSTVVKRSVARLCN